MYDLNVYKLKNHAFIKKFFYETKDMLILLYLFKFKIFYLYLYMGDSLLFYEKVSEFEKNDIFFNYFEIFCIYIGLFSHNSINNEKQNYTFYYNKKLNQIWYKINSLIWINKYKTTLFIIFVLDFFKKFKHITPFVFIYFNYLNSLNNFFKNSKKNFGENSVFNYVLNNYLYSFYNFDFSIKNYYKKLYLFLFFNFNLFIYLFKFFKNVILPVIVGFLFIYYSFFFFKLSFVKTLGNWVSLGLFIFWLISTFNFFIKRYRFAKYTSAIQRFWKRAFMCFWMIEGFLFMIFFYYLLNASGEPYFMFDMFGLTINHLIIIKSFLLNSFLIILVLNLFIFLLINIKFTTLKKNLYLLLLITFIFMYILFVESYQFYYLLNFYIEYIWIFSEDDNVWELEYDIPRTRNKNHYITLIIVAKFWHYIFIFASWIFFILKLLELSRIRYAFLSMNFQNIILFYIMNWLCLYSWLKWLIRRFMDQTYYWFFTSFRPTTINIFFNDFVNYLVNFFNVNYFLFKSSLNTNFYYVFNDFLQNNYGIFSFFKNYLSNIFLF